MWVTAKIVVRAVEKSVGRFYIHVYVCFTCPWTFPWLIGYPHNPWPDKVQCKNSARLSENAISKSNHSTSMIITPFAQL